MTSAQPRDAATVIVLREGDAGAEVLLLHRHPGLRFMGDYWAFPGGRVDPSDLTAEATGSIAAAVPALVRAIQACPLRPVGASLACALVHAARRELEEEAGLRLHGTERLAGEDPGSLDSMVYWARWITPAGLPRRYDTHFFAVEVARHVTAMAADGESTEARWLTIPAAIIAGESGAMKLAAPTLISLRDIARALEPVAGIGQMLRRERGRAVVPLMPKMLDCSDEDSLTLMPWDPRYPGATGEGIDVAPLLAPHWHDWPSRLP